MEQRWNRPLNVEPGHWKKQLPGKYLMLAAKGDVRALKALLKEHPDYLSKRGSHNRTLLWMAVRAGQLKTVAFLAEQGADVNAVGCYNGESHVQISPYGAAHYYKRPAIADYLKSKRIREDIFRHAFLGNQAAVLKMLAKDPDLLNAEDPNDEIWYIPLLSFAVAGGQADLAAALINTGAQVTQYSAQLFWLAAKQSRLDILELLLAHGAEVQAVESSVYLAAEDLAFVRRLLELGAPVNQVDAHGNLPLRLLLRADKRPHLKTLDLLLEFGLDVNAPDPRGQTALAYAQAGRQPSAVDWLLAHGATPAR